MVNRSRVILVFTAVLLAASATARAESSLGIAIGYVKAKSVESSLFVGADFRFHLGKTFALAPEFSYWKKSGSAVGVTAALEDLQFGANALITLPVGAFSVFAGGGGGFHDISGSVAVRGVEAASNSSTKGGLDVMGGVDIRVSEAVRFSLGARYDWVLGLAADPGGLDQVKLYGGFRLSL